MTEVKNRNNLISRDKRSDTKTQLKVRLGSIWTVKIRPI